MGRNDDMMMNQKQKEEEQQEATVSFERKLKWDVTRSCESQIEEQETTTAYGLWGDVGCDSR